MTARRAALDARLEELPENMVGEILDGELFASMPDVPFFDQAPDWVCKVLSPSTALRRWWLD